MAKNGKKPYKCGTKMVKTPKNSPKCAKKRHF